MIEDSEVEWINPPIGRGTNQYQGHLLDEWVLMLKEHKSKWARITENPRNQPSGKQRAYFKSQGVHVRRSEAKEPFGVFMKFEPETIGLVGKDRKKTSFLDGMTGVDQSLPSNKNRPEALPKSRTEENTERIKQRAKDLWDEAQDLRKQDPLYYVATQMHITKILARQLLGLAPGADH